jgi:heat shock protein HslJ
MQKKKHFFTAIFLSVLLVLLLFGAFSCKADDSMAELGGDWYLTMINGVGLGLQDPASPHPFIRFDPGGEMISGYTGCNQFTGEAFYAGNTIEVGSIISTLIACQNMEIEEHMLAILSNQTIIFQIEEDTLIITNDTGGQMTLIRQE